MTDSNTPFVNTQFVNTPFTNMAFVDAPVPGRVGIVMVNYNGMRFMPDCLESLSKIDYPDARIVIIDNASADGSREWIAAHYPGLALISLPTNQGVTAGNNAGICWSLENGCAWVLLLNNDTVVEPNFLTELVRHGEPNALTIPKIYFFDNRTLISSNVGSFDYWRGLNVQWFYGHPDSLASNRIVEATMASTCAMLISSQMLNQVGMMDNKYFIYYDDTDFVTRAVRAGNVVRYIPTSVIYHKESSSSGGAKSPLSIYYLNRNRLYFMFKHQKNRFALAFFLLYFTLTRLQEAGKYLVQGKRAQFAALKNAVMDFCRDRMGYSARFLAGRP